MNMLTLRLRLRTASKKSFKILSRAEKCSVSRLTVLRFFSVARSIEISRNKPAR
jgi:hypothetical protein